MELNLGQIPKRRLGRTDLEVTLIGLGGADSTRHGEAQAIRIIHRALDLGINFYDNSWDYWQGQAEEYMGKALVGRREEIFLMTKVEGRLASPALQMLEQSLRRLKTDYLDIWQFHDVRKQGEVELIFDSDGAIKAAEQARKEGKVRFIGLTGHHDPQVLLDAIRRYQFDTVQMPLNLVDPHYLSFEKEVLPELVRQDVGIIAMKTLAGGTIVSKEVATVDEALCYAWSLPVGTVVSGCQSVKDLEHNVAIAQTFKPLSKVEKQKLLARTYEFRGTEVEAYKRQIRCHARNSLSRARKH